MAEPIAVIMPKLGLTMEEGAIEKWLKEEGEYVKHGDPLFVVAMDKASMEIEATARGVLAKIVVPEGGSAPIGGVIAYLGAAPATAQPAAPVASAAAVASGSSSAASAAPAPPAVASAPTTRPFISPRARRRAEQLGLDPLTLVGTGPNGRVIEADVVEAAEQAKTAAASADARATPAVRQLATQLGVNLAAVVGSGPGGRITERDVRAAVAATEPVAAPTTTAARAVRALTRVRRVTAERMAQSARSVARVTLFRAVGMDEFLKFRDQLNPDFVAKGTRLGYDVIFAKAAAIALTEHPVVGGQWVEGQGIVELGAVNIGTAVALEPEGLVVPVLRDVDRRDLLALSRDYYSLLERALGGKLTPDDMSGGAFTITNLGALGVDAFTPIVNPPEAAILGVGRIQTVATVLDGGKIEPRQQCQLSLSFDHRVVDGAPAAKFLGRLTELIERPYRLLANWS